MSLFEYFEEENLWANQYLEIEEWTILLKL